MHRWTNVFIEIPFSEQRKLFQEPPLVWFEAFVKQIMSYSARRVLPTVADVLGLGTTDRASLGLWSDNTTPESSSAVSRRIAMPSRALERAPHLRVPSKLTFEACHHPGLCTEADERTTHSQRR